MLLHIGVALEDDEPMLGASCTLRTCTFKISSRPFRSGRKNLIAVLMGGRAAEQLVFEGDVSTGADDDLQRATEIALGMVTRFGMDEKVGQRTYAPPQTVLPVMAAKRVQAAEATAREIDVAVRDLLGTAFERAQEILRTRRGDLDTGAQLLLKRETVTADDFSAMRVAKIATEPGLAVAPA